jgi:secreted trypsin-like serine protease
MPAPRVLICVLIGCSAGALFGGPSAAGRSSAIGSQTARPRARSAVIGGASAKPGSFPWLAYVKDNYGRGVYECTGTVVSPSLVLTAAHCATSPSGAERDPAGYTVTTASVDLNSPRAHISRVSEVLVDPSYDPATGDDDAAMLVLRTPTTAPAIPLAGGPGAPGTLALIAGWGETAYNRRNTPTILRWARATVQTAERCQRTFHRFDSAIELCAMNSSETAGTCRGDSGGPLLAQTARGALELGLLSAGLEGCPLFEPRAYTRADILAPWVRSAARALSALARSQPHLAVDATPGAYATVPSAEHRVSIRVTADGRGLVDLHAQATIACERENIIFNASFPRAGSLHEGVLSSSLAYPRAASWAPGRLELRLRVDAGGLLEGRLYVHVHARTKGAARCYPRTVRFWASRAG